MISIQAGQLWALHVRVKRFNVILKRMRFYSKERRGLFRKNILTYNILQREVLQAQTQVEENAIVMKNDCNQYSILELEQNSQTCEILQRESNRTW